MTHARNTSITAIIGRGRTYALAALAAGFLGALVSPYAALACGLLAVFALGIDMHRHVHIPDDRRDEP